MTGKLPAMQFYPGDWMKDPALRSVSAAARGLWADMLCLMFESPSRGYLMHSSGSPVTSHQIARMTGIGTAEVSRLCKELWECGVYSKTDGGVIYCRRMVRDEHKRTLCKEAGKLGGNPILLQGTDKGEANPPLKGVSKGRGKGELTPSSSSSLSSSTSVETSSEVSVPPAATVKGQNRFQKPTVAEIREYAVSRNTPIDADKFFDFYTSKGWKVGSEPMKDWRAAVRNWVRGQPKFENGKSRDPLSGLRDFAARGEHEPF